MGGSRTQKRTFHIRRRRRRGLLGARHGYLSLAAVTVRLKVTCKDEIHHRLRLSLHNCQEERTANPLEIMNALDSTASVVASLELRNVENLCW